MKLYFIRHAPTKPNLTGEIVENYDEVPIIENDYNDWHLKFDSYLPKIDINTPIFTSPILRCKQTCEKLFNRKPNFSIDVLKEFDCKELKNLKFWEITQEQFEDIVKLRSNDMEKQIDELLNMFDSIHKVFPNINNIISISHGMVIRYIYFYLNNNKSITPYEIINSKGFSFTNLDILTYDNITKEILVNRYKEPIIHN